MHALIDRPAEVDRPLLQIRPVGSRPGDTRAHLKTLLLGRYAHLHRQIERFVGSKDDASDVLQETWLRLELMHEASLNNGEGYLLRMATNIAVDHYRREKRHFHEDEVDDTFELTDELADPERIVAARRKLDVLRQVVLKLPLRQREILLAARIEGELNREIARRLGISQRLVEKELSAALKFCNECMKGIVASGVGPAAGRRKY